ncbi:MAG: TonB-dependent receptor [Bacteroidales bacterium]
MNLPNPFLKKYLHPLLSRVDFVRIIASVILFLGALQAQPQSIPRNDSIAVADLLMHWQQQHQVLVYVPHEYNDMKVESSLLAMDPRQSIARLKGITGLDLHQLYGVFVFVSPQYHAPATSTLANDMIVVGREALSGRYARIMLRGVVQDGATGETLPGAIVYSAHQQKGVSTSGNGTFEIELSTGEHTLEVSFLGFISRQYQVRLYEPGEIALELFSDSYSLAEVVVRSSRLESNHRSTQMSLIRLNAQELKNIPGSYGERDIVRSISLLPGVQNAGEFGTGFHVRGGGSDQNLILLENLPVFNSSNLFGMLSMINPDIVENASLYKGGIPAKYGERASAILDIRLDRERGNKTQLFKGGVGLLNTRMMSKTTLANGNANLLLAGRSTYSNWLLENTPDVDLMNSNAGFYDITAQLTFRPNTFNSVSLLGFHNKNRAEFTGNTRYQYANTLGNVRWDRYINAQLHSALMIGFSHYGYSVEDNIEKAPMRQLSIHSELLYQSVKWNLHFEPSPQTHWDIGFNAMNYSIQPGRLRAQGPQSRVEPLDLQSENALELSAYISAGLELHPRWSVEAGLRLTSYTLYGPYTRYIYEPGMAVAAANLTDSVIYGKREKVFGSLDPEPRISIRWLTDSLSSVKLSYGRSMQYINQISSTAVMTPADTWKLSNDLLPPLAVDQYAVGFFRSFADAAYEASIEVYYKRIKNGKEYTSAGQIVMNPFLEQDVSLATGKSYGTELFFRKGSGRLTGWVSYTFSRAFSKTNSPFEEKQINRNAYFPSDYDRPHNMVFNGNFNISRRWRFHALFTWSSGRPLTLPEQGYFWGGDFHVSYSDRNKYRFPNYHRLDVSLSLDETLRLSRNFRGSWSLSVINVYGRKNPYSIFYEKNPPSPTSAYMGYSLYQLYIIGRPLPTITYNLSF